MIKTIKVKKQLRLDELIKYVWDNHLYPETFKSNFNDFAHFDKTGKYQLIDQRGINQATKFTVEVEEEITKDTRMAKIVILTKDGVIHRSWNDSINGLKIVYPDALQIHALVNGKLELIYERSENL